MSCWVVVPAAGIGARMEARQPKQYLTIADEPMIVHTLKRLASCHKVSAIVVVIAQEDERWPSIKLPLRCPLYTVIGGETRADSVMNGLAYIQQKVSDDPWVLVHDAARPCIRMSDIESLFQRCYDSDVGGILGAPVVDTIKKVTTQHTIAKTVDRAEVWRALTPQMFRLEMLRAALLQAQQSNDGITDEASAIEAMGYQPLMIQGHADNIKVTVPDDLLIAEAILQQQRQCR